MLSFVLFFCAAANILLLNSFLISQIPLVLHIMMSGRLERHIVLVGYMAVGKTTVGAILAERLQVNLVDTDQWIEKQAGISVSRIFAQYGEAHFRALEKAAIVKILDEEPCVIATGGGLPCVGGTMDLLSRSVYTAWLMLGVDKILDRLAASQDRPLIAGMTGGALRKSTRAKLKVRRPFYRKADIHVQAWHSPERVADRILKKLKK